MYLYQIDNKLIVSKTKRPEKKHFETTSGKIKIHDWNKALSEWQKNLIPVKEGEEEKFRDLVCDWAFHNLHGKTLEEDLQKGIPFQKDYCLIKEGFAYLNSQPKKEDSNEAIEFESQVDLAKEIQGMFEHNKDWIDVLELFEIKRK